MNTNYSKVNNWYEMTDVRSAVFVNHSELLIPGWVSSLVSKPRLMLTEKENTCDKRRRVIVWADLSSLTDSPQFTFFLLFDLGVAVQGNKAGLTLALSRFAPTMGFSSVLFIPSLGSQVVRTKRGKKSVITYPMIRKTPCISVNTCFSNSVKSKVN